MEDKKNKGTQETAAASAPEKQEQDCPQPGRRTIFRIWKILSSLRESIFVSKLLDQMQIYRYNRDVDHGELSEWFKVRLSKSRDGLSRPRVRIPCSP